MGEQPPICNTHSPLEPSTKFSVYVLGSQIKDEACDPRTLGDYATLTSMPYDVLLRRAQARTFNLQRKLQEAAPKAPSDREVAEVLGTPLFVVAPVA